MSDYPSKTQRRPWLAAALSAVLPGLGHIYCGQIVIGIILMLMTSFFCPVLLFDTHRVRPTSDGIEYGLVIMFGVMTVLVGIIAVVDSWRQARRTKPDYELKDYNRWYVYLALIVIFCGGGVGYALQIRDNYIEAFRVPADSMVPTIFNGDRVLALKTAYNAADPKPGDIVVFANPDNRRQNYVKRVVAVAGDTVEIRHGRLYINDVELETEQLDALSLKTARGNLSGTVLVEKNDGAEYTILLADQCAGEAVAAVDFAKTTVPEYCCFVLGDNRNCSNDSRHFGPIHLTSIKGRFDYLYFPAGDWSRFGRVK